MPPETGGGRPLTVGEGPVLLLSDCREQKVYSLLRAPASTGNIGAAAAGTAARRMLGAHQQFGSVSAPARPNFSTCRARRRPGVHRKRVGTLERRPDGQAGPGRRRGDRGLRAGREGGCDVPLRQQPSQPARRTRELPRHVPIRGSPRKGSSYRHAVKSLVPRWA